MEGDSSHAHGKRPENQERIDIPARQVVLAKEIQVSSAPIDQLNEFIMGTIKDKYEETIKSSHTYAKPYTTRIDSLNISAGYQPSKF